MTEIRDTETGREFLDALEGKKRRPRVKPEQTTKMIEIKEPTE